MDSRINPLSPGTYLYAYYCQTVSIFLKPQGRVHETNLLQRKWDTETKYRKWAVHANLKILL